MPTAELIVVSRCEKEIAHICVCVAADRMVHSFSYLSVRLQNVCRLRGGTTGDDKHFEVGARCRSIEISLANHPA